jgi:predicted MFS family arabinose efflux permease
LTPWPSRRPIAAVPESPPASAPPRLAAPLALLAAACFAAGAGARMLEPLLPLLAREFAVSLGGASALVAGFALTYGAGQIVTGPLGDRFGKLLVIGTALLLYAATLLFCALASDFPTLVALRALSGAMAGAVIPLAFAWVGDRVPYAQRQATLSRVLTGMVLAQLLAGPIAGIAAEFYGWRAAFLSLGAIALVVGLLVLRGAGCGARAPAPLGGGLGLARYHELLRRPAARRLLASGFFEGALLVGGAYPFVGAFGIERLGLSASEAGLLVACFGVGLFGYTRAAPLLVRRLGERRMVAAGGAVQAAALLGLALAPHWAAAAALLLFAGLGFYMLHGVLQARATEALPEARGTAVAAFALALFAGQGIGAAAFGALIAATDFRLVFALAAPLAVALARWARAGPPAGTRASGRG